MYFMCYTASFYGLLYLWANDHNALSEHMTKRVMYCNCMCYLLLTEFMTSKTSPTLHLYVIVLQCKIDC